MTVIKVGSNTARFRRGVDKPGKSRLIPPELIWDEMTQGERETIAGSGSNKCKAFMWTLALSKTIRRGDVKDMLQRLEDGGFLPAGRTQEIVDALR